ncbi:hypothetical protein F5148DRAFT_1150995 [Russula earlei]|uniref:Uncharacterized protein n=1 Tax=Russula earlei TaxID=71964 RepID=A0ACC0U2N7_9AGAM|nr:hypothetical protein F5148DRAFT_1150995 [Russula earlei]
MGGVNPARMRQDRRTLTFYEYWLKTSRDLFRGKEAGKKDKGQPFDTTTSHKPQATRRVRLRSSIPKVEPFRGSNGSSEYVPPERAMRRFTREGARTMTGWGKRRRGWGGDHAVPASGKRPMQEKRVDRQETRKKKERSPDASSTVQYASEVSWSGGDHKPVITSVITFLCFSFPDRHFAGYVSVLRPLIRSEETKQNEKRKRSTATKGEGVRVCMPHCVWPPSEGATAQTQGQVGREWKWEEESATRARARACDNYWGGGGVCAARRGKKSKVLLKG